MSKKPLSVEPLFPNPLLSDIIYDRLGIVKDELQEEPKWEEITMRCEYNGKWVSVNPGEINIFPIDRRCRIIWPQKGLDFIAYTNFDPKEIANKNFK